MRKRLLTTCIECLHLLKSHWSLNPLHKSQMKMFLIILVCCCVFQNVINATPAVNSDAAIVMDTLEEAMCQSLPNSAGEIVFLKTDATAQDPILYMKKNDGTTTELFSYGAGIVKVSPPATEAILWLNDDCFVCVSSGRRNSYYAIYKIARESPDNTMLSTLVYQLAEGCYRFNVNWYIENGILKASLNNKTISQIDIL